MPDRSGILSTSFLMAAVLMASIVILQSGLAATAQSFNDNISLQGIWKVSLAGTDITMAINQSGTSLDGRCKFEGDLPWNGVVAGSLLGSSANIAIAALQGTVLVSTEITGSASSDELKGSYLSYDSEGKRLTGDITGTKISPNVEDYIPAQVEETGALAQQTLGTRGAGLQEVTKKSRFMDVTEFAKGIDPNIMPMNAPL